MGQTEETEETGEYPDHHCENEVVEVATQPYRTGAFWWWEECQVCGRRLTPARLDSLL